MCERGILRRGGYLGDRLLRMETGLSDDYPNLSLRSIGVDVDPIVKDCRINVEKVKIIVEEIVKSGLDSLSLPDVTLPEGWNIVKFLNLPLYKKSPGYIKIEEERESKKEMEETHRRDVEEKSHVYEYEK